VTPSPPVRRPSAATSVALVLVVGALAGILLGVVAPQVAPPPHGPCSGPVDCPPAPPPRSAAAIFGYPHVAVVLACVALATLLALLVVYGRTYRETRAPQILGLLVFLLALLLESVLTSPFLFARFGGAPAGVDPYLLAGQAFEVVALALFLYLSLQ
jgi:hypothetical protein